jgi:cytochrome c oxidase subunit 1
MAIAIPTGVKIFNWIATLWGGNIRLTTPMLFALGFIALFTIGGLSGMTHAAAPSDLQQTDTYYIVAHLHYVLFGGSIMGILGGIYYWFPKMTGRLMSEALGKINFVLIFIGMNMTFGPMHYLGLVGMPRRNFTFQSGMGWDFWNLATTIGAFIIVAGMLVFVYNFLSSRKNGEIAGNDPWDARTLEWSISSPPPHYNFVEIPQVHSREPFWDEKYPDAEHLPRPVPSGAAYGGAPEEDEHDIHMPSPSYYPLVTAIGLGLLGVTLVTHPVVGVVGIAVMIWGIFGWAFEPAD